MKPPAASQPDSGSVPKLSPPSPHSDAPATAPQHLPPPPNISQPPLGPSALYRADTWLAAAALARTLPRLLRHRLARTGSGLYWLVNARRRRIVCQNLLPVLDHDATAARKAARDLFGQFALKLTDLWCYESPIAICNLFHQLTGWEHLQAAQQRGRGLLLLTIHLGNWEFGAPLLTRHGLKLQVVTLAEPHAPLTEVRRSARARWGVETVALTPDPFASLEVIRALEANEGVALLMDRPPAATAVSVSLFGHPFLASVAAAQLARATGCALLPVYVPRTDLGYSAWILPEVPYERASLRSEAGRLDLTQRIMNTFQPVIRLHPSQWYHFVPIWPFTPTGSLPGRLTP